MALRMDSIFTSGRDLFDDLWGLSLLSSFSRQHYTISDIISGAILLPI